MYMQILRKQTRNPIRLINLSELESPAFVTSTNAFIETYQLILGLRRILPTKGSNHIEKINNFPSKLQSIRIQPLFPFMFISSHFLPIYFVLTKIPGTEKDKYKKQIII